MLAFHYPLMEYYWVAAGLRIVTYQMTRPKAIDVSLPERHTNRTTGLVKCHCYMYLSSYRSGSTCG